MPLPLAVMMISFIIWRGFYGLPGNAFNENGTKQASPSEEISTIGYVSWWSHDAVGYHPAVIMKVENTSGGDLSSIVVRFQGRFTDLRNGSVTVARKELCRDFAPHQQITVMLRAPRSFELPIDNNAWPTIECKAMCRIGAVGDEGTQDLLVTRLEPVAMTDEEALFQLTRQTGVGRGFTTSNNKELLLNHQPKKPTAHMSGLSIPPNLPALGDDFYIFEKFFGMPNPSKILSSKDDLTWVSYPGRNGFSDVFVGSRGSSGKADLIVVAIPARLSPKEEQLSMIANLIAGKFKGQNITSFIHSVRYLPGGRSEIAKAAGQDCRIIYFKVTPTAFKEAKIVLAASRLPWDLESSLATFAKRVQMLQMLLPALALDEK